MNLPPADLQRLLAEEPFVRKLAQSLLADEADDVVQQTWLRAMAARPGAVQQVRAWLARIVRNLAADQRRASKRREDRERSGAPRTEVPSSAELLLAEERRRELVAAVDGLPENLRTVVLLRWFEGLPPRRIAAQLEVPVQVVWNRLHTALGLLHTRLDAAHRGDRRAWLLPLVPFASSPRELPWSDLTGPGAGAVPLTAGMIAMTSKTKVWSVAAVLGTAVLAWVVWTAIEPSHVVVPEGPAAAAPVVARLETPPAAAPSPDGTAPREPVAAPTAPPTTGTVVATVRYASEPTAGADLVVVFSRPGDDFRTGGIRAVTDAEGRARFEGLAPGPGRLRVPGRSGLNAAVTVEVGATQECTLQERSGMTLSGIVVDGAGVPIGGALVEVGSPATLGEDAAPVAVTAADGTFTVRACLGICVVGARARGFAASQMHFRMRDEPGTETVRIELLAVGGVVEGIVLGPDGEPVPDAIVRVGEGRTDGIFSSNQGAPPLPAQVRTDAVGRFVAIGVPVGPQPLMARATGLAPWRGSCEVAAGGATAARIVLSPGVTCLGRVLDEAGNPVPAARVTVGKSGDFVQYRVVADESGLFTLRGLPSGEVEVAGEKRGVGKATVRVAGEPGGTVECVLRLGNGLVLRGRVVDEVGVPVARASIMGEAVSGGPYWRANADSDANGRFQLVDCPPGRRLTVNAGARERVPATRSDLLPGSEELVLQLPRDTSPRARLVGRLLRPDGTGAVGHTIEPYRSDPRKNLGEDFDAVVQAADGAFAIAVPAGTWTVRIMVKDHPTIRFDGLELAAGAVHDFGVLQITHGGTLRVEGDGAAEQVYLVLDRAERFVCGLSTAIKPPRTELLAPGDYWLLVRGKGFAATVMPFTIREGAEARLEVRPAPGVCVQVEFVPPVTGDRPRSIAFVVRRAGALVALGHTDSGLGELTGEVWLAPGNYELVTRERQPATTFPFTVAEAAGPPLRIVLR
ncbi:MAG: sigma-70 family RNA polymerase sigma factor [Planctomycetota bacterium]